MVKRKGKLVIEMHLINVFLQSHWGDMSQMKELVDDHAKEGNTC